ncbi:Uncharacterised protein [uncultured archaeon]|nr:Uncharacterised protein [uncultured archaeon]
MHILQQKATSIALTRLQEEGGHRKAVRSRSVCWGCMIPNKEIETVYYYTEKANQKVSGPLHIDIFHNDIGNVNY